MPSKPPTFQPIIEPLAHEWSAQITNLKGMPAQEKSIVIMLGEMYISRAVAKAVDRALDNINMKQQEIDSLKSLLERRDKQIQELGEILSNRA